MFLRKFASKVLPPTLAASASLYWGLKRRVIASETEPRSSNTTSSRDEPPVHVDTVHDDARFADLVEEFNSGAWLEQVECLPCFQRASASPCADAYSRTYFFCHVHANNPIAQRLCGHAKRDFQECYKENKIYYEVELSFQKSRASHAAVADRLSHLSVPPDTVYVDKLMGWYGEYIDESIARPHARAIDSLFGNETQVMKRMKRMLTQLQRKQKEPSNQRALAATTTSETVSPSSSSSSSTSSSSASEPTV